MSRFLLWWIKGGIYEEMKKREVKGKSEKGGLKKMCKEKYEIKMKEEVKSFRGGGTKKMKNWRGGEESLQKTGVNKKGENFQLIHDKAQKLFFFT